MAVDTIFAFQYCNRTLNVFSPATKCTRHYGIQLGYFGEILRFGCYFSQIDFGIAQIVLICVTRVICTWYLCTLLRLCRHDKLLSIVAKASDFRRFHLYKMTYKYSVTCGHRPICRYWSRPACALWRTSSPVTNAFDRSYLFPTTGVQA